MNIEKQQRRLTAKHLHDTGMSCTQISRELGITRQRVHQIISGAKCEKTGMSNFQKKRINSIVYPNIREFIYCSNWNVAKFLEEVCKDERTRSYYKEKMYNCLCGGRELQMEDIRAVLDATGLTFEEAFKRD